MTVFNVVGARPNLVKIAPLLQEMSAHRDIVPLLVHTGQHYDERLSDLFFRQMGIPQPDVSLGVGSGPHGWQTAEILKGIEQSLLQYRPDLVLVVGDVNSTIAATLAAAKLGMAVAHVESGLRSFDRRMPEEINRLLTDTIADHLFVTEEDAIHNLVREGRSRDHIYFVGNVMIDALRRFLPVAQQSKIGEELGLAEGDQWRDFAVLTLHRPSNVDSTEVLENLLYTIQQVSKHLPVIFPIHPRTQSRILKTQLNPDSQLRFIQPVGYVDFLCLLSHAKLVLTDSGGIQEETTALNIPCLTLRENTERPVTVREGTNEVVGMDAAKIGAAVEMVLAGKWKSGRLPPLWDGMAAKRIVETLRQLF